MQSITKMTRPLSRTNTAEIKQRPAGLVCFAVTTYGIYSVKQLQTYIDIHIYVVMMLFQQDIPLKSTHFGGYYYYVRTVFGTEFQATNICVLFFVTLNFEYVLYRMVVVVVSVELEFVKRECVFFFKKCMPFIVCV